VKKNAKPELTGGWWRTNQPHGLSSAKALEDALKAYEAALKLLEKSGSVNHHLACVKTIDALRQAAKKAQDDAEKMLKSPPKDAKFDSQDVENTVSALKKLPGMLDEAREEADDLKEEDEGLFGNAEKYQLYLKKWLKKARSAPLTFAFVAGATSAEHRIMLHRSKDPTALLTKLKTETKLKKGTFGMAGAHPEDNTTLVLELYTKPLPGLSKKFRLLLKRFKPLPFNRVLVTMEGNAVTEVPDPEDTEPEEDESIEQGAAAVQPQDSIEPEVPQAPPVEDLVAAELMAKFKGLTGVLNTALTANPPARDEILALIERFKAQHKESRLDDAGVTLNELRALLKPAAASAAQPLAHGNPQGAVAYGKARLAWLQARTVARNEIDRLAKKIIEDCRGEPDFADIEAGCENLYDILDELDQRLADELDAALNAASEDERQRLHAQARKTLDEYRAYVDRDELLNGIDDNAFVPVRARQTMSAALTSIGKAIS
jgi:hypothetical protein